ncbi:MAG: helix-turn-helix domain-containing protein [Pseudomonadota bacterium]
MAVRSRQWASTQVLERNGLSDSQIGAALGRSRTTIWREVKHNQQKSERYCPLSTRSTICSRPSGVCLAF